MSSHSEIPYQSFWDIGMYMFNRFNEPKINMDLVLGELVALHQCRTDKLSYFEKKELCRGDVGSEKGSDKSSEKGSDKSDKSRENSSDNSVKSTSLHECKKIKSINSDICSLCSDDTDNTVFKYYISDDEIIIDTE